MKAPHDSRIDANPAESAGSTLVGARSDSRDFQQVPAAHDARHERELATDYLQSVEQGEPSKTLALRLAATVAATPEFQLVLAVLAGGTEEQAIALADLVLGRREPASTEREPHQ